MATQTLTSLVSDLDGKEGATTIQFGLDGKTFEIDLGNLDAANLRRSLAKYIDAGREVKVTAKGKTTKGARNTEASEIRTWGQANGFQVGARGRLDAALVTAYREATATVAPAPAE